MQNNTIYKNRSQLRKRFLLRDFWGVFFLIRLTLSLILYSVETADAI